jgi:hypothetical protein
MLLNLDLRGNRTEGRLDVARQVFQRAQLVIATQPHALQTADGDQRRDDFVAAALHARGVDLHHGDLAVAVHHQSGQAVTLAVHPAVERHGVKTRAQCGGGAQTSFQLRVVKRAAS